MSVTWRSVRPRRREDGQTLVIFAVFLIVLLASAALAIDYGSLLKVRRDYQNVADAAVLAGSVFLTRPVSSTKEADAREAAWKSIEEQLGLTLDETTLGLSNTAIGTPVTSGGFRMWVSTPPLGGPAAYAGNYAGSNRVLFAWVEKDNPAFLSRVIGFDEQVVSAWATAGTFANRFAVITLRKNGEPGDNTKDFDIQGTGTVLRVIDGDVGGNWGMALGGSGPKIRVTSSTADTYGVFLTENVSGTTPGNGWTADQVVNGTGVAQPVIFQAEVPDPNYPAPCVTFGAGGCLVDRSGLVLSGGPNLLKSTPDRVGDTCPAGTTAARLPSGRYDDVTVPNNKCIILDPTYQPVAGKSNGIFYFTGDLNLDNSALVIGQGVTIVFASTGDLTLNAGPLIILNNDPTACAGGPCRYGAWTSKGRLNWTVGNSPATPTFSAPTDPFDRGIASYVFGVKTNGRCSSPTSIVKVNSNDSAIDFRGLIYAPCDNVKLAGNPTHHDIGQIVSWSLTLTGGAELTQTFDGPDSGTPVLLEPRLGQ